MKALVLLVGIASVAGCGEDTCSKSDVNGVYTVATREISGTCGSLGTMVVRINNGRTTTDPGCTMAYERWSENDCKREADLTCTDTVNNLVTHSVASGKQDPGGNKISMTATFDVKTMAGVAVCNSTYELNYSRD